MKLFTVGVIASLCISAALLSVCNADDAPVRSKDADKQTGGTDHKKSKIAIESEESTEESYENEEANGDTWHLFFFGYRNQLVMDMDRVTVIFAGIPHDDSGISGTSIPIRPANEKASKKSDSNGRHHSTSGGQPTIVIDYASYPRTGTTKFSVRWSKRHYKLTLGPSGESITVGRSQKFDLGQEKTLIVVKDRGTAKRIDDVNARKKVFQHVKNRIANFEKMFRQGAAGGFGGGGAGGGGFGGGGAGGGFGGGGGGFGGGGAGFGGGFGRGDGDDGADYGDADGEGDANHNQKIEVYDVGDLGDSEELVFVLTEVVAPETWEDVGGEGTISALGEQLTVKQTEDVHALVKSLLDELRKIPQIATKRARSAPKVTQRQVGQQPTDDGEPILICCYPVGDLLAKNDFEAIRENLTLTVQPDSWADVGGRGQIIEITDRGTLVVSNTKKAHKEIRSVLSKLRRNRGRAARGQKKLP